MWISEREGLALEWAAYDEADRLNAARDEAAAALTKRAKDALLAGGEAAENVFEEHCSSVNDFTPLGRALTGLLAAALQSDDLSVKAQADDLQALLVDSYVDSLLESEAMERMS